MLEDLNLGQIAQVFGRDYEKDETIKKIKRGIAAYAFGKSIYYGGKNVRDRWQKRVKDKAAASQYVIRVNSDDTAYNPLWDWIMANQIDGDDRSVTLSTRAGRRKQTDDDWDAPPPDPEVRAELLIDSDYAHDVEIDGHQIKVELVSGKMDLPPDEGNGTTYVFTYHDKSPDEIIITVDSVEARDAVRDFVQDITRKFLAECVISQRHPYLYMARFNQWKNGGNMRLRPLDSVILRDGQLPPIMEDLEMFLKAEKQYLRRSIPWHRGYLFHGPPGTGKTSLAMGLASQFGLNLFYIPLGDMDKDASLIDLIGGVTERSILLFEDVDVFSAATKRTKDDHSSSLSALLNALDGAMTPHGLITVMTTNNLEALDSALVRPGRVDRLEELGYVDEDQASRLFRNFYPEAKEEACSRVGRACVGMAPAEILEVCKRHLEEAKVAADELVDNAQGIK